MRTVRLFLWTFTVAAAPANLLFAIDPAAGLGRAAVRDGSARREFRLPRDLTTPVVSMTFVDSRAGTDPASELAIYADGRVEVTSEPYSRDVIGTQLPPREWLRVQRVLFVENDLLHCDSQLLAATIDRLRFERRRPCPGPEAAVTVISLRGENIANQVRCHAVGLTASQFPDLPEIQRVFVCQQCLQNIVHVVRAGGYEQLEQTLQTVNTKLQRQLPGSQPLQPDNLSLVDRRPDGTQFLQFSRLSCPASDGSGEFSRSSAANQYLLVSVYDRPDGLLEISIVGDSAAP